MEERKDLMSPSISTVWLEYKPNKGKKLLICQKYREFNPLIEENEIDQKNIENQLKRFDEFNRQVDLATREAKVLISGDLNIDILRWRCQCGGSMATSVCKS